MGIREALRIALATIRANKLRAFFTVLGTVVGGLRGGETVVSGSYAAVRELEDGDPVQVPEAEDEKGKEKDKDKAKSERRTG